MSEFKFACPVCGQHITADSNATGSQIECPTCYRGIVVPQKPSSTDPKFILATSEVNKPRVSQIEGPTQPGAVVSSQTALRVSLVLIAVLIGAIATILFVARGKFFAKNADDSGDETASPAGAPQVEKIAPRKSLWTMNLSNVVFPDVIAAGTVRDRDFECDRAVLQGGTLTLRQKQGTPEELNIIVVFFTAFPGQLSGKSVHVKTNDTGAPRVIIRWKEDQQTMSQSMSTGYALRMEFGTNSPSGMPGAIFLCLPDDSKSWVAGTFNAEVRRAATPRPPRQPKPKKN